MILTPPQVPIAKPEPFWAVEFSGQAPRGRLGERVLLPLPLPPRDNGTAAAHALQRVTDFLPWLNTKKGPDLRATQPLGVLLQEREDTLAHLSTWAPLPWGRWCSILGNRYNGITP
jgi:hypothetical protein